MKTLKINVIRSEEGFLELRNALLNDVKSFNSLRIKEKSTGKIFINFGGFNGNPWDLWLRKNGTKGLSRKTFIRVGVQKFSDIKNELKWSNLPISDELEKEVLKEIEAIKISDQKSKETIELFSDQDKAAAWVESDKIGNSHARRTRWANRAERMGLNRFFGSELKNRCYQLINK